MLHFLKEPAADGCCAAPVEGLLFGSFACGAFARGVLACALICGMGSPAMAGPEGQSAWSEQTNSKVRLVSGVVTTEEAPKIYAGVQLRMADGWKTYWRNPGDSGVPPVFDWSGSENVKAIEVFYPAPHRFADAGGTAIGYDREVVFPVRVTPERPGDPVTLSLNLDYGLCKDLCIPVSVVLEAIVSTDLEGADGPMLEVALSHVPKEMVLKDMQEEALPRVTNISATLEGEAPGLEIEAEFPEGATDTDVFVHNPQLAMPVPKPLGPLTDGKQRFAVDFPVPEEAEAIKDRPLSVTLVSNKGATETIWIAR